jgi:hypothetical protein
VGACWCVAEGQRHVPSHMTHKGAREGSTRRRDACWGGRQGYPSRHASRASCELRSIDLSYNTLSGVIPSSIGSLTCLTYVALPASVRLECAPPWLTWWCCWACRLARELDMSSNDFDGNIPETLQHLTALQ